MQLPYPWQGTPRYSTLPKALRLGATQYTIIRNLDRPQKPRILLEETINKWETTSVGRSACSLQFYTLLPSLQGSRGPRCPLEEGARYAYRWIRRATSWALFSTTKVKRVPYYDLPHSNQGPPIQSQPPYGWWPRWRRRRYGQQVRLSRKPIYKRLVERPLEPSTRNEQSILANSSDSPKR